MVNENIRKNENECESCFDNFERLTTIKARINGVIRTIKVCDECLQDSFSSCHDCGIYSRRGTSSQIMINGQYIKVCSECVSNYINPDFDTHGKIKIDFKINKSKTFKENKFKTPCGVEIETTNDNIRRNVPRRTELEKLQTSYVPDGSVNNGGEFVTNAFNGDLLLKHIDDVGKMLKKNEWGINSNCGLHIHLEANKRISYIKKVMLFYVKFEDHFFKMISNSRQNNRFCKKFGSYSSIDYNYETLKKLKSSTDLKKFIFKTTNYAEIMRKISDHYPRERYSWVNLVSLWKHGTIEIRSHQGTTEAEKIKNWLMLHLQIQNFVNGLNFETINQLPTTDDFFLSLFDDKRQKYIKERWKKFRNNDGEN